MHLLRLHSGCVESLEKLAAISVFFGERRTHWRLQESRMFLVREADHRHAQWYL